MLRAFLLSTLLILLANPRRRGARARRGDHPRRRPDGHGRTPGLAPMPGPGGREPRLHGGRKGHGGALRALGLEPGGERGWFQDLPVEYNDIRSARLARRAEGRAPRDLALGSDFVCRGLTGSAKLTAPVVFAGYGLSEPARGYDDYAGLDARGKIVLAFKEAPPFKIDTWVGAKAPCRAQGAHGEGTWRGRAAAGLEARAGPPAEAHRQRARGRRTPGRALPDADAGHPRRGRDAGGPPAPASRTRGAHRLHEDARLTRPGRCATLEVRARYEAQRPSVNVVAILRGSDPALRDQCVVVARTSTTSDGRETSIPRRQ